MPSSDLFVSIVAPLHNDADIVEDFVDETVDILASRYANYEVVLVDDGSRDETCARASAMLKTHPCMRLIRLSRKFGQEIAISAGLDSVIGDFVVVMLPDSDPPALVPAMVEQSRAGAGIVFGIRRSRPGEPWWLRAGASIFYTVCNRFLGLNLPRNSTHFRALSRQALNAVIQIRDRTRYLRTLSAFVGYTSQGFDYDPLHRRKPPRTKGVVEAVDLAINIVVSNSTRPLRLVSWVALLTSACFLVYAFYLAAIFIFESHVAANWVAVSLQSAVAFFLLFLILTVLSEYLGRLLGEIRQGPLYYVVEERNSSVLILDEERRNVVSDSSEPMR